MKRLDPPMMTMREQPEVDAVRALIDGAHAGAKAAGAYSALAVVKPLGGYIFPMTIEFTRSPDGNLINRACRFTKEATADDARRWAADCVADLSNGDPAREA